MDTQQVDNMNSSGGCHVDAVNMNTTAIEAISERLAEVTALAEQLDRALTAAHLDPSAPPPPPSIEDVTDAPDLQEEPEPEAEPAPEPAPEPAAVKEHSEQAQQAQQAEPQQAAALRQVLDESEDFITASECTCTPPSRSSSFHTASEGGVTSPWWELEEGDEADPGADPGVAGSPSRSSKQVQTMAPEISTDAAAPAAEATASSATREEQEQEQQHDVLHHHHEDGGDEREVLAGVVTQRQVTETRQLVVRRGGGETRAASELSCSRLEVSHLNNGCNASTSSTASTLSSGTRGALESVLQPAPDEDASSAAYLQQLEESLPLDLPSPLAFADPTDPDDPDYMPPPPQELLDGLKESREWLQLRVLECTPELAHLGATLEDALQLQNSHHEVLRQLQSKQSPVEELLRQADQLISTQGARAEVYAAMAESLGAAWKDVNSHLETRRRILDLNVNYHSRAEECTDRMLALQLACTAVTAPMLNPVLSSVTDFEHEADSLKDRLSTIHDLRRAMLEALMFALTDGKALLEMLRELAAKGSIDSRPDTMRISTEYAISQVEHWLEGLHDKRKALDLTFTDTRTELEQRLALALLGAERTKIEQLISARTALLTSGRKDLGNSEACAELLLHEHAKVLLEAKDIQERALKMTHATDQLAKSGASSSEQAVTRSYTVLNSATEYLEICDSINSLLYRAIAFFQVAHIAATKLDQLEVQLTATNLATPSRELASLHAHIASAAYEVSQDAVEQGLGLLDTSSTCFVGTEGVKRTVEEIERRRLQLESLCTAHKEENIRLHQALNNFLEKQNDLYSWLVSRGEAFLQGHQDMGSVLAMARDFNQAHHQLIADLQVKGTEINNLLLTLPPILEEVKDEQRIDIDQKVESLHNLWLHLKQLLEGRIDLAAQYVEFHEKAVQLAEQIDAFEDKTRLGGLSSCSEEVLDDCWDDIQRLHSELRSLGHSFISEANKASDPYLDVKRAVLCVETLLHHFAGRQIIVSETRDSWQKSVTIEKENRLLLEKNLMESIQTVDWVSKLDAQLYPILSNKSSSANTIRHDLERKLETVLPEVRKAQSEVEERIRTTESMSEKVSDSDNAEESKEVLTKLIELRSNLQTVVSDYQVLVQLLLAYFKNLSELEKTVETLQSPDIDISSNVDSLLKEHDSSTQAVIELFKFTEAESEQIIQKIKKQEPEESANYDVECLRKLLADKRVACEAAFAARRSWLEKNQQQGAFDRDLAQINYAIADLGRQLEAIRGQYGESLSSAKATSAAFDYFEKTIELLEQRIQAFVSTSKQVQTATVDKPSDSERDHVEQELEALQKRWAEFRGKVAESRKLIELSIQYFQLVEEAGEWFKQGSRLLVSIARRSAAVRFPESANELLTEMETFLKPGEARQDERIQKISELAKQLYGEDKSQQVNVVLKENREMLDSFSTISRELNSLAQSLSQAEKTGFGTKPTEDDLESTSVTEIITTVTHTSLQEVKSADDGLAPMEETIERIDEIESQPKIEETTKDEVPSSVPLPGSEKIENSLQETVLITEITQEERLGSPEKVTEADKINIPPNFVQSLEDASIQEGGKFTFKCRVTGSPAPEVVWEKDGISINNNPDYMTTHDGDLCTLTIEETFTEDSARFACRASNSAGVAETSAVLNVIESEPEQQLSPPVFVVPLADQTAQEGTGHTLECVVEGTPLPTVQWFKEENCVDDSPDHTITYNNGQAKLKLEEVRLADQAQYTCKANNSIGAASTTSRLTVEPLKPTEGPSFPAPLSNVMARAGHKIKLECAVVGTPAPTLTWTHDGKPVKETRDLKTVFEDGKAMLVISEAFPKDAGSYTLTARNAAGETTSSCTVTVKGRLPTETSDSELASDLEPIKPAIQMPLKDTDAKEGERVRLDCIIVGQPEPEVIWYYNDRPVKESADFQLLFHGDRCSLVVREALPEDSGSYRVVAINSAGEASSECLLTVHASEPVEAQDAPAASAAPGLVALEPLEPVEALEAQDAPEPLVPLAPRFTRLLADVLVAEGECVRLECVVEGRPRPDIRWCQNNKDVLPSDRIKLIDQEDGTIILVIESVNADDRGVYTARASNSLGEAKCFSNLIVKSALSESKSIELADKLVPPAFKEKFSDNIVAQGTPVKFECIVTGRPAPKVRWFFNDEPVSGKGFLVSKSGDRDVLSIPEASHSGRISCSADNEAGRAACCAKLLVREDLAGLMSTPDGGAVSSSEETSQSFTMKRAVFMQSSSSTTSTSNAGPAQTQAHSISTMSEQFSKQVNDEPPLKISSELKEEVTQFNDDSSVKTESSLLVAHAGDERRETLKTSSGVDKVSAIQAGPAKPTRRSTAPRFVSPLNGKIVDQCADILLEGIIDGYPTPTVSWTKNGQDIATLPEADFIKTSYELNRVRLEMQNVRVRDAGRYTCRAENPVGSAVCTADVVVKKTVFPPVMGKRLQVQQARVGERISMEVEVTGLPEPTVTWSKDGLPLSAFPHLEIRTKTQGSCYSLVIDKASLGHAGNYAVRATNAGGEAHCSADVAVWEALPDELMDQQQRDVIFRELMEFPAMQKHESFQTSKHESFQSESSSAPLSLPKEVPVAVSPAASQLPPAGVPESLHVSETTKTEKHFSIQVDRTPSPLFAKPVTETQAKVTTSTFTMGPEHRETNIPIYKESTTSMHQVKSEMDSFNLLPKTSDLTLKEQPRSAGEEDGSIDSSSIPTQTALQFFMSKIKESEDGGPMKPVELKEPVNVPAPQKLTEKISLFERKEQDEQIPVRSPEAKETIPVAKLSDRINLFEHYEGKPEAREENQKFEEQIWKSYKHTAPSPPEASRTSALPDYTEPYMPGRQVKTDVQHSRVIQQETKTWSGTMQVPGKLVPSAFTKPITFKEETRSSVIERHVVPPENSAPDDLVLQPEPPPEMCYTPKAERSTKVREDMAERVKKLQDSQKSLDPLQVPTGGVRIFPSPAPSSPQTPRVQPRVHVQAEQAAPHTPSFLWPQDRPAVSERRQEVKEQPMVRQVAGPDGGEAQSKAKNAETVGGGGWTTPTAAAVEVPLLPVKTTSSNTTTTSFQRSSYESSSFSSGPILRPAAAEVPLRATSPRPAAEALSMEKLWTSHRTSESEKATAFRPVSPMLPSRRPVSDGYTMSSRFSAEASMYSSSEQKRGASPRPSSEGLAMEKLWAQHKPAEYQPPAAQEPAPRPTPQGASQGARSSIKRSWPPPQPTEAEKVAIPWAPQNPPEKVWSPEADRTEKFEFERKDTKPSFRPVAPPITRVNVQETTSQTGSAFSSVSTPPVYKFQQEPSSNYSSSSRSEVISESTRSERIEKSWSESTSQQESCIVEEKHVRPSEAKRLWPPNKSEYELQAPHMVKKAHQRREAPPQQQQQRQPEPLLLFNLEPGPPPEMGFAAPPSERRRSMVESIEEDLEKTLEREPARVVPGGVRVIPPPQPKSTSSPALREEPPSWTQTQSVSSIRRQETKSFQSVTSGVSDGESDLEASRAWRPAGSVPEEPAYRRVRPPSAPALGAQQRYPPASEPLAPSAFEKPAPIGVFAASDSTRMSSSSRISSSISSTQSRFMQRTSLEQPPPPLDVKPALKTTPDSPKSKHKTVRVVVPPESGYMADTDEPRTLQRQSKTRSPPPARVDQHQKYDVYESSMSTSMMSESMSCHPHRHDKRPAPASVPAFKEMVASPAPVLAAPEPISAAPAPTVRPKRAAGPAPRSPSKFVKGDFRESDYESDFDGRIPAVWRPYESDTDEPTYKPVRAVLGGGGQPGHPVRTSGRSPTPPTEFDNPPHFGGPPRPKFEPIEKPLAAVKASPTNKKVHPVFRPKPIQAKPPERIEVSAARKDPPFRTPHAPNTMHETSQSMSFAEATETSRRVVSMQQTTRVIKFNEQESKAKKETTVLQPFPFQPEPERRSGQQSAALLPRPSKFVPGEFKESDYESELESVRFKPKWVPYDSDTDEPHYRKVQPPPPALTRSSSVPAQSPVDTPDFSQAPYVSPARPAFTSAAHQAEQKRLLRVEEMRRRFEEKKSTVSSEYEEHSSKIARRSSTPMTSETALVPGPPPEFGFSRGKIPPEAEYVASKHMSKMTQTFKSKAQQFVDDIIYDAKTTASMKPDRPILKKQSSNDSKPIVQNGDEPQAYREESRLAEYGTKHIDPETGLIYFKYDFGYEFGIILPGEGKVANGQSNMNIKRARIERSRSRDEGGVEFPVIHEKTEKSLKGFSKTTDDIKAVPLFRPKKFSHFKSVKWDPHSESEVSEAEVDTKRWKRHSFPQSISAQFQTEPKIYIPGVDQHTPSPVSVSPSVPSLSPYTAGTTPGPDSTVSVGSSLWTPVESQGCSSNIGGVHSGVPINSVFDCQSHKSPIFITPLRDIAVVNGQSARFECIVQAEPPPNILWSKDGRILENSQNTQIQYRNGVCRLTVSNATSVDAGSYTCTATNRAGTASSTSTLLVPGERRISLSHKS